MDAVLAIDRVTKAYGECVAVQQLSLEIKAGEVFGLLGPNGAGKTTTLKMVVGLVQPTEGAIKIAGYDILNEPLKAKRNLGYVPDEPWLYEELTGEEFLFFTARLRGLPAAKALDLIREHAETVALHADIRRPIRDYSRGMKQKLAIVAALLHAPRLLVMDEPLTAIDAVSAHAIQEVLRLFVRDGGAILLATHMLDVAAKLCTHVGIINQGRLLKTGPICKFVSEESRHDLEQAFLQILREE